jgi:hypothetical protein
VAEKSTETGAEKNPESPKLENQKPQNKEVPSKLAKL